MEQHVYTIGILYHKLTKCCCNKWSYGYVKVKSDKSVVLLNIFLNKITSDGFIDRMVKGSSFHWCITHIPILTGTAPALLIIEYFDNYGNIISS